MSFLFFGKKEKTDGCCCSSGKDANCGGSISKSGAEHCVKVLGSGCSACKAMYENVKAVVEKNRLDIDVQYITDMSVVSAYGVMSMPALVLDDKVVSSGKVLKPKEIEKLIQL